MMWGPGWPAGLELTGRVAPCSQGGVGIALGACEHPPLSMTQTLAEGAGG